MQPTVGTPHRPVALRLSVMMFLQFFVWGAWYVSVTGWLNTAGIADLTAWTYTVGPIAAVISPFFLGLIADRFFPTQIVLAAMHLLGGAFLIAIPSVVAATGSSVPHAFFHPYVLLLLGHMLCYMPTLGLTNTLSFHHMAAPEKQFPVVRVFGTIGWIVGNFAAAGRISFGSAEWIWNAAGDKSPAQFYWAGGAAIVLGLYSFTLPHTPPPAAGKRASIREILGLDSLRMLADRSYLVFILCSFLICIPLAGYYNQARNFVEYIGFESPTFTMSYGQMSEIVFMLLMPAFFARLGAKWMLAMGMLAWVVRYGLFAAAADNHIKWMVLIGIILHGICYDFFFVAGSIYVDQKVPREIRGQAQGFLVLITQGLGLGLGAQVFNLLVAHYSPPTPGSSPNWPMIWAIPAAFALGVLLVFVALFRDERRPAVSEP